MGPRIYGMGYVLSRQGGGIGTKGIGETNTELMQRHWRREMKKVKDELDKITANRKMQLDKRRESGFKTVSIVGYTNAGKSSLFNLLSGKGTLEKDELFATLDSSIGKLFLNDEEILVSDTIGFIRDLPPTLISAFKSTLMESVHADILLHVVDASDPEIHTKITVVQDILRDLGRHESDVLYVFNKIDKLENTDEILESFASLSPIVISVVKEEGIDELREKITEKLSITV
jgi:GTP-binding protein HflX